MTHPIYILTDAQGTFIAVSESREKLEERARRVFEITESFSGFMAKPFYLLPLTITPAQAVWEDKK